MVVGLNWDHNSHPPLLITGSPKAIYKLVTGCMINSLDVEDIKIDDEFYEDCIKKISHLIVVLHPLATFGSEIMKITRSHL